MTIIEVFRGHPRGATTLLHLSKCSRPFLQAVKSTLSYLKSCNPLGAPHQAPLEKYSKNSSGKKKEPKPKHFGPGIFGWGAGLPREQVGAKKKLRYVLRNIGKPNILAGYPGFLAGYPGGARKV